MTSVTDADVALAQSGDAAALDRLLRRAEPLALNLALRMLGRRDDALDATQVALMHVATHLSGFRGESRFTTWVYRIAANAVTDLLRERRRQPARSFSDLADDLERGLAQAEADPRADATTPEERVAATELALLCTQGMLMALEPEQRLAYLLGEVMELDGPAAAGIAAVSPEAFRQRLARAREALRGFMAMHCGLVSAQARCRCDSQLRALPADRVALLARQPSSAGQPVPLLRNALARQGVQDVRRLQSVARVFRAHPQQHAPIEWAERVRAEVAATVFGRPDRTG